MGQPLLIIGASVRAAAMSAVRGDLRVVAVDLFGDQDLQSIVEVRRVGSYRGISSTLADLPATPWCYTGGLENHPNLIRDVSARHPLLGCNPAALAVLRDPFRLQAALQTHKIPVIRVGATPPISLSEAWLRKPIKGCGGQQVIPVGAGARPSRSRAAAVKPGQHCTMYYQQFVHGVPHSAVFVAAAGRAHLLGTTRQLIGCSWAGSGGFRYVGSLGPVSFDAGTTEQIRHIGDALVALTAADSPDEVSADTGASPQGLQGLFGVDFILAQGIVRPVEVNPRYTASIEILERAGGFSAMRLHHHACTDRPLSLPRNLPRRPIHGKAIVFTRRPIVVGRQLLRRIAQVGGDNVWPGVADIPQRGTVIPAGGPIATVFARGPSTSSVVRQLQHKAAFIRRTTRRQRH